MKTVEMLMVKHGPVCRMSGYAVIQKCQIFKHVASRLDWPIRYDITASLFWYKHKCQANQAGEFQLELPLLGD